MRTWRFLHTGNRSSAENMAIDEAILLAVASGESLPTIRFYGWQPATLSIGYFQKVQEINLHVLREEQTGFVRRLTGGRAVLHEHELTYSIIVPEDYPGIPRQVTEAYRVLSEGLLIGYQALGLDAKMMQYQSEQDAQFAMQSAPPSAACFDAPSWYEVVVDGRKVAGSAQIRKNNVLLQHGSILLEHDTDKLFRYLHAADQHMITQLKNHFNEKSVTINDLLRFRNRKASSLQDIEPMFKQGLRKALAIDLQDGHLSDKENQLTVELIARKYGNEAWNLKK
jgi:lipoate-protein ligase A